MQHLKPLWMSLVASALLAACGGGGGDPGSPPPHVSAGSVSAARYSETMLITLLGSNLDQALTFTSAGCRNFARSTTAPNISSAVSAYFTCTVSGVGDHSVSVSGGAVTAAVLPFTIEVPQVTLQIGNGAAVSGSLVITLSPQQTPLTVDNFLAYVKSGFYDGTVFHRHGRYDDLSTFVLQGGGYAAPVSSAAPFPTHKTTLAPIALEVGKGLSNTRYTLAMARTSAADSATSEFFINTVDNGFLDTSGGGYAVFGTIATGTTLVDAMAAAPCTLSPINFDVNLGSSVRVSVDCVPEPNLVVISASQTR